MSEANEESPGYQIVRGPDETPDGKFVIKLTVVYRDKPTETLREAFFEHYDDALQKATDWCGERID